MQGLIGTYYDDHSDSDSFVTQHFASLPMLQALISSSTVLTTAAAKSPFSYTSGADWPALVDQHYPFTGLGVGQHYFVVYTGNFYASTTGDYMFQTDSDDGSAVFIDGSLVVNNNRIQVQWTLAVLFLLWFKVYSSQSETTVSSSVHLSTGWHPLTIAYYQSGGYAIFSVSVQPPGGSMAFLTSALTAHMRVCTCKQSVLYI